MATDATLDGDQLADTSTIVDGQPVPAVPVSPMVRGATIGRYLVIEQVGQGGMGVVVRAYDPKLHREIALKRLHRDALDSEAEARLLREAQALAQLSHPNVITIYDVERTADGVVMAMEYAEGRTFSQWIADGPHPWQEVLARFGQAGRGLAAAHASGLVHRDFKPGNVILGPDGRVRVMDFGLARAEWVGGEETRTTDVDGDVAPPRRLEDSTRSARRSRSSGDSGSFSEQLTEAGAVMGTPAYMATEQHRGEVADARSDQYAFCVSLWEALWGSRPFVGDFRAIVLAKHEGPPAMPRGGKVPRWVYDVIQRGLDPRPERRWPSMETLLEALAKDPTRHRRTWLAAGSMVVLAGGLATVAIAWPRDEAPPCQDGRERLAGVWDDARRAEVQAALQSTELSYADPTWERVSAHLDDYAEQWVQMYADACQATAVERMQSEALLDLRMQCLRRRRLRMEAAVDVLAEADAEVAKTAIQQVTALPSIDRCADTEALTAAVPPPDNPQLAKAVEHLRDELTQAQALTKAGRYADSRTLLDQLLERVESVEYAPVEAQVLEAAASLAALEGDFVTAVEQNTRAYELALRVGDDQIAVETATALMFVTGHRQTKIEVGRAWASSALALAKRVDPGGAREGMVLNGLGVVAYRDGDFGQASRYFEQALPMLVEALGEDDDRVATNLNHLGAMLDEQGRYSEAEPHFRRALEIQTEVFGPEHPRRTLSMDNLALCLQAQGRNEDARDIHQQAIELRQRALGEQHPDTALTINNLGWDYMGMGDPQTASTHFQRALEMFEAVFGAEHPRVAMAAESLALAELRLDHHDRAEQLHRRALEIRRRTLGEDHINVALSLGGLGGVAFERGEVEEAIDLQQQALAIMAGKAGAERYVGDMLTSLGHSLVAAERPAEAIPHLERALKLREGGGGMDPAVLARLHHYLAQARHGVGETEAAEATAREGLALVTGVDGDAAAEARTKIQRWLDERD